MDKPRERVLPKVIARVSYDKLKNKLEYISLILLTFVICTCTMTFSYGSVNMAIVLLLNLNPGNIWGFNQALNSQGIDIPSPIRTLCIP